MTLADARRVDSGYSRITLVGRRHRADLVLPSGEPVGMLLGEMLDVLGEQPGPTRLVLLDAVGRLIPAAGSLADAGVADGAVLRLVAEPSAPPPPVVNDITEEVAADLDARDGRWSARTTSAVTTTGAGVVAASVVAQILVGADSDLARNGMPVLTIGATFSLLAWMAGRSGRTAPTVCAAVVGFVLTAGGLVLIGAAHEWERRDLVAALIASGWVAVAARGACRRRGEVFGAALGLVLVGGWFGSRVAGASGAGSDAVVVALAVLVCGLLPRWALTVSGLAALDDARLYGVSVRRERLRRSLREAHLSLRTSVVAVAVTVTVCGIALTMSGGPFAIATAAVTAAVVGLRARTFPLAAEGTVLLAAAAAVGIALVLAWVRAEPHQPWSIVVSVAVGTVLFASTWLDLPEHARARLRGVGDRLETIAVIAMVPLVVGVFGMFGQLLHTFSK